MRPLKNIKNKRMKQFLKTIFSVSITLMLIFSACDSDDEQKNIETNENIGNSDVPKWAKEAVWYQIFPERFRNGDPGNDPRPEDILGTYPDFVPEGWKITPWESDWYKADSWFKNSSLPDKWNNLQLRRYGGDLQGVIDKLDYLLDLGITAIYFNPLNDSPSLHKYDPRHWRHIDRNFGPKPEDDKKIIEGEDPLNPETWKWTHADSLFLKVIKECKKRKIRVVMDYSFNHTGKEFWAFKDIQKNGKDSKVADWFEIESFDDPSTEENEFSYKGWAGVIWMPEMNKDIIGDHEEMPFEGNLHSEGAKQHIFSVARRWLDPDGDGDPSDGIDGYRLDVAAEVPMGFWVDFRKEVRKINPEAYLVGEIWWKKWPEELMFPHHFLKGDMFDAIMNYRWYRPARHFFADAPDVMKPSEFVEMLKDKMDGINIDNLQVMMNLVASHDAPRVSSSLYNNGVYKYQVKPYDNPDYKIEKPDSNTVKIQKMLLIHQFTYIGAPHIWNGDEVGMWGADDPDCRKPMVWDDIEYEDETHHPFGKKRKTDKVEQDKKLLKFYKDLIRIRKENPTLIYGDINFILADDENNILAYSRTFEDNEIIVLFNKSNELKNVSVETKNNGEYRNIIDSQEVLKTYSNKLNINILPNSSKMVKYGK
jgi:cyclomaltodextrinase